jgi:hypothetical protein
MILKEEAHVTLFNPKVKQQRIIISMNFGVSVSVTIIKGPRINLILIVYHPI